mmetsp:Transcript_1703/g.1165  ORF Transcript_1703/g.1165 Transcript_1703/m.1165 type:complete len:97 (-) Transcript_1703:783-1073(-)
MDASNVVLEVALGGEKPFFLALFALEGLESYVFIPVVFQTSLVVVTLIASFLPTQVLVGFSCVCLINMLLQTVTSSIDLITVGILAGKAHFHYCIL